MLLVTWSLRFIGDDAADKVWLGAAEVCHQLIQIFLLQEEKQIILNEKKFQKQQLSNNSKLDMDFLT